MKSLLKLTAIAAVVLGSVLDAHICIMEPRQRGPMSIAQPGDPSCYRRTGPCGSVAFDGIISEKLVGGQPIAVQFQQNLNHWYAPKPGTLDVSFAADGDAAEPTFTVLATVDDYAAFDMVTQSNFSVAVTIPAVNTSHGILRVRYTSNNPMEIDPKDNTDAVFYNCADVAVETSVDFLEKEEAAYPLKMTTESTRSSIPPEGIPHDAVRGTLTGCMAPPEMNATLFVNYRATDHVDFVEVVRSNSLKRVAVARNSGGQTLLTVTDYNTELEYVVHESSSSPAVCEVYGPDAWYPMGFGQNYSMPDVWVRPNDNHAYFHNPTNGLIWMVQLQQDGTCWPLEFSGFGRYTHVGRFGTAANQADLQEPASCLHPVKIHHGCQ